MTRSLRRACLLLVTVALALPSTVPAAATVPVRVRIIKGSRQGPPAIDPKLRDLTTQLGALAYQRWDEVGEHQKEVASGKPVTVPLPDGSALELTLVETKANSVTFELRVPSQARSRLTIAKEQRIVQQVAPEKNGEALFVTVRPWP